MTQPFNQQGAVFERDGLRRELVRVIPAHRGVAAAVEWRRPGQEWRSSACSLSAWEKWVRQARRAGAFPAIQALTE